MGALQSKSPLERRNTIARRSQRRTLVNLKPKVTKINKDIKKFKGMNEADVKYNEIKKEIEILKNELVRRGRDLQPQIRDIYENVYKGVSEAEVALQAKLEENREKHDKKNEFAFDEQESSVVSEGKDIDITSNVSQADTIAQIHAENQQNGGHEYQDQRKSQRLQLVKVSIEEDAAPPTTNPTSAMDKRKSILKVGIPVMPGAVLNELAQQPSRLTRFYDLSEDKPKKANISDRINEIAEEVRRTEDEIANFVGVRNGVQYMRINNVLEKYMNELQSMPSNDEYIGDQLSKTINYVNSCVRFLMERASDPVRRETVGSDDVFENNVVNTEHNFKLQKMLRNTAV